MGRKGLNGKEGKHNSTPERGEYSSTLHITGLPPRSMRCVVISYSYCIILWLEHEVILAGIILELWYWLVRCDALQLT